MSALTTPPADEKAVVPPRVRTDVRAGGLLLAVVIGGNLVWRATDAGIVSALAGR
jgi:hypothetical protein